MNDERRSKNNRVNGGAREIVFHNRFLGPLARRRDQLKGLAVKFFEATGAQADAWLSISGTMGAWFFGGMQHLFGLEWPRRGGGVFQLGQESGGGRTWRSTSVTVLLATSDTSRGTSNKGRGECIVSWKVDLRGTEEKIERVEEQSGDRKEIEGASQIGLIYGEGGLL